MVKAASRVRFDILRWKPARAVVLWVGFPVVFQALALAAVGSLAVAGFGVGAGMNADGLMTLRKTNLSTLVVWGLWWPAMIAVAIVFGRAWCTVCPMELVSRAGDSVARRIGWPRAHPGRFLRAGWPVVFAYLVLQILVAGFSIHRVPHYTAIFLVSLMGAALGAGLVFRGPRSFCTAFCPAGALLSVYGRTTPIGLETRDASVCGACATKDCVRESNRYRFDKRSCPSLLRPFHRGPSDGCVLCLQCAKVCPHDNVGVGLVSEGAPVRRRALLRPAEAAFVMVALGFVSHEVIGEVKWLDAVFHASPAALSRSLPGAPFGWFEALWFLVGFPLGVCLAIAGIGFLWGHRGGFGPALLAAATGAAPVVAIAHLAKAAAKVAAWAGFFPLAIRDPRGLETLDRIASGAIATPPPLAGLPLVGFAMLALTAAVAWKAWRWARQVPPESAAAARTGLAGAALLFGAVLTVWVWPT